MDNRPVPDDWRIPDALWPEFDMCIPAHVNPRANASKSITP